MTSSAPVVLSKGYDKKCVFTAFFSNKDAKLQIHYTTYNFCIFSFGGFLMLSFISILFLRNNLK